MNRIVGGLGGRPVKEMIHRKQAAVALAVVGTVLQREGQRSAFAGKFFPEQHFIAEIGTMTVGVVVAKALVGRLLVLRKCFVGAEIFIARFLVTERRRDLYGKQRIDLDIGAQVEPVTVI